MNLQIRLCSQTLVAHFTLVFFFGCRRKDFPTEWWDNWWRFRQNGRLNSFGHLLHWYLRLGWHICCCLSETALYCLRELLVKYLFWHCVSWLLIERQLIERRRLFSPHLGTLLSLCLFLSIFTLPLSHTGLSVISMNPLSVRCLASSTYVPLESNSAALIFFFFNTRFIFLCSFLPVLQIKNVRI